MGCEIISSQYLFELPYKNYDLDDDGNIISTDFNHEDFVSAEQCMFCHEEHYYDWVYKISADIFKMGKVMEEIRRKKYKKNGLVLVQFKTQEQRNAEKYNGYKKTFEEDLENLISSNYNIIVKELPLTTSECKAEGFID